MGVTQTEQVLTAAMDLDAKERARVARELLHSLDGHTDTDAHAAWTSELARRRDEVHSGAVQTLGLDEVKALVARTRAERQAS